MCDLRPQNHACCRRHDSLWMGPEKVPHTAQPVHMHRTDPLCLFRSRHSLTRSRAHTLAEQKTSWNFAAFLYINSPNSERPSSIPDVRRPTTSYQSRHPSFRTKFHLTMWYCNRARKLLVRRTARETQCV